MTEERIQDLYWCWEHETNDDETQEWRDELTAEEQALVDQWDYNFDYGLARMIQDARSTK